MNPFGSVETQLARQFYAWENRGRGWTMYGCPVEIEPPFRQFSEYVSWHVPSDYILGRHETLGSRLLSSLLGRGNPAAEPLPTLDELAVPEPQVTVLRGVPEYVEFSILLPADYTPPRDLSEQLLAGFHLCDWPVSFELVGQARSVSLQLACAATDRLHFEHQVETLVPEAVVLPRRGFLQSAWNIHDPNRLIVDFGPANEFMRPLRTARSFPVDPLAGVLSGLVGLGEDETVIVQVLAQQTRGRWAESIWRAIHDNEGNPFFLLPAETPAWAKQKIAKPLFATVLRVAVRARTRDRVLGLARRLSATFNQFALPQSNELIPLDNDLYAEDEDHDAAFLSRTSYRPGMLLNAEELTALFHFPGPEVRHPAFLRISGSSKPAPHLARGGALDLGSNEHNGERVRVTLSNDQRMRHTYIVGASGSGKSVLLLSMILQDVERGVGLAVVDPHGDLVDEVLARIPRSRHADAVVLDPADEAFPVGLNILAAHTELERTLLSSDLVALFRRFSTSWDNQMSTVLGNAVLAFLEHPDGGSLLDLKRFLGDAAARAAYLRKVATRRSSTTGRRSSPFFAGTRRRLSSPGPMRSFGPSSPGACSRRRRASTSTS